MEFTTGKPKCMTDSQVRTSTTQGCLNKFRSISTYSLDTKNISYTPRLLEIGSKEWPTLDCAFKEIKANRGGYVLKLNNKLRDYHVTESLCRKDIDDLMIIGDDNPFSGVSFVQHCSISITDNNVVKTIPNNTNQISYIPCTGCYGSSSCCSDSLMCSDKNPKVAKYGRGPFNISLQTGNILSVRSVHGEQFDPDFSCIPPQTSILFFVNSQNVYGSVIKSSKNWIQFSSESSVPLNTSNQSNGNFINHGNGFCFIPNVKIVFSRENYSLETLKSLKIVGVLLEPKVPVTFLNCINGSVVLNNCLVNGPLAIRGNWNFDAPNVFIGSLILWQASRGEAYCQTFFGLYGHLQAQPASISSWNSCNFIHCASAVEVISSDCCFPNSNFVHCCMALSVTGGGRSDIINTVFCENNYAIIAIYNSDISALPTNIPGAMTSQIPSGPWFINNLVMIVAYSSSHVILPLTGGANNIIPFIIDGKTYTTIESNPVGNYNQNFSIVIIIPNPFTPNPRLLGCPGIIDNEALNSLSAWGVTTPSGIESILAIGNTLYTNSNQTLNNINQVTNQESRNEEWLVGSTLN